MANKRSSNMDHIDYRVNEIEAEVVGLKVAVSAIDEKIDRQTQVITDIVKGERTNPATIIGISGLMLSFVVFYNSLTIEPVMLAVEFNRQVAEREALLIEKTLDAKLTNFADKLSDTNYFLEKHSDMPSHTGTIRDIQELAGRIKVLEERVKTPIQEL